MRRNFWNPAMSGVDWDGVLAAYRPLLDRVRGADDFTDLLWEVVAELGTSHSYILMAGQDFGPGDPGPGAVGLLGADISRDGSGRWVVDRVLPGESSDPRARPPGGPIPSCARWWWCRCGMSGGCGTRTGWPAGAGWCVSSARAAWVTCISRTWWVRAGPTSIATCGPRCASTPR